MGVTDKRWQKFIKSNLRLLLSKNDCENEIHKNKHAFFIKILKKELGLPKNKEIAHKTIEYLLFFANKEEEQIDEIGTQSFFLSKYLGREQDLTQLIAVIKESQLSPLLKEDLSKIGKREYFDKLEEEKKAEIEREKKRLEEEMEWKKTHIRTELTSEYKEVDAQRQALKQEKQELEKLKSEITIISESEISEEDITPPNAADVELERRSWWKRLGFNDNPFPTTLGLTGIKEEYWEEIVIKTDIFEKVDYKIRNETSDFLSKTYFVLGGFGSGKTTLFQYLEKPLLVAQIYPINVLLDPDDAERIAIQFLKEVKDQLSAKYEELHDIDLQSCFPETNRKTLFNAMEDIKKTANLTGFTIFIDGLHKDLKTQPEVFRFLQKLQNTTEYFLRNNLQVSFFVAGHNRWKREIENNRSFSGSFYAQMIMPEVSEEDALTMFNRRFKAFSEDKENPTTLKRGQVEKIYKALRNSKTEPITFRDLIDEILPHLEQDDMECIQVNLKYDQKTLQKIKTELLEDTKIGARFKRLKEFFKSEEKFEKILKYLVRLSNKKYLEANSDLIRENKHEFALLAKMSLIENVIINSTPKRSVWKLNKDVEAFDKKIKSRLDYSLSDYLLDLFEKEPYKRGICEPKEVTELKNLISEEGYWPNKIRPRLEKSIDLHLEIVSYLDSPKQTLEPYEVIERAQASLSPLIESILIVNGADETIRLSFSDADKLLKECWFNAELKEHSEFRDKLLFLEDAIIVQKQATELAITYRRSYELLVEKLREFIKTAYIVELSSNDLSQRDKQKLGKIRNYAYKSQWFFVSRDLSDYGEEKMRQFLYNVLEIKYGKKWRRKLGTEVNDAIYKNIGKNLKSGVKPAENSNVLYEVDRAHYRQIITEVQPNWTEIFAPIFYPKSRENVDEALKNWINFAVKDKHLAEEKTFLDNSPNLINCIPSMAEIFKKINGAYEKILDTKNVVIEENGTKVKVKFSFLQNKDTANASALELEIGVIKEIITILKKQYLNKEKGIDLSDRECIEYEFRVGYPEFIAAIAVILKQNSQKNLYNIVFKASNICLQEND